MAKKVIIVLLIIFAVSLIASYSIFSIWGGPAWWNKIGDINGNFNPFRENNIISNTFDIDETKSESTRGIDNIKISGVSSNITIFKANDNQISAKLYGTFSSSGKEPVKLTCIKQGDTVKFKIDYPKGLNINTRSDMKLDVYIPDGYDKGLDVKTVSGDIYSEVLYTGSTALDSVSGNIKIDKVLSEYVKGHTVSGDMNVKMASKSNNITLDLKSVSGDLTAEYLETFGLKKDDKGIKCDSTSGKILLTFPENSAFKYEANSVSGSFTCDFPTVIESSGKNHSKGTVNDGSNLIDLKTVSGDISIVSK